jgi:hypothetical protein
MFHFPTTATPARKAIDALETVYALIKQHATRENAAYVISSVTYGVTFAIVFTYFAGQALAKHCADRTVDIAAMGPDDDLDAIADDFFAPLFEAVTLAPEGPTFNDLNNWSVKELRESCKACGIVWRNVNGASKHLSKAQMIGKLL